MTNDWTAPGLSRRGLMKGFAATAALMGLPAGALRAAAEGPRYGGTFVVCSGAEPRHLNQNVTTDIATKLIANPIFSKLINLKSDLTFKPELATEWTVSPDGRTIAFTLHGGVKWHDGTPFTAGDAKFTFEEILFKNHNIGKTLAPVVVSVEATDDTHLVFTLTEPNDVLMTFIAGQGYIQARHIYEGQNVVESEANMAPVGTGPFRFSTWKRGQEVVLERNQDYFLADQPYVDRIVTRFIPEATARIRALQAGEVDYVTYNDLPLPSVKALQASKKVVLAEAGHEAWGSIVELMMNLDKEPFKNPAVRKAIAHALDVPFIIDFATFGLGKAATGPVASTIAWAYTPDTTQYPHDIEKAKALLDEAGFPIRDGKRFAATISCYRSSDAFVKVCQIVAEQLKAVGIEVEVTPMDAATASEFVYVKREFDFHIQSFTTGPDPAMGVQRQYMSTNIRPLMATNGIGYRNAEVDDLLLKAAASGNRAERAELYRKVSKVLCDDCAMIWLYENPTLSAYNADYGNLHGWAAESIYSYGDVYWKGGKDTRA